MLDRYKCIDSQDSFVAQSYYVPEGTELFYFKVGEFDTRLVAKEDILSILKLS